MAASGLSGSVLKVAAITLYEFARGWADGKARDRQAFDESWPLVEAALIEHQRDAAEKKSLREELETARAELARLRNGDELQRLRDERAKLQIDLHDSREEAAGLRINNLDLAGVRASELQQQAVRLRGQLDLAAGAAAHFLGQLVGDSVGQSPAPQPVGGQPPVEGGDLRQGTTTCRPASELRRYHCPRFTPSHHRIASALVEKLRAEGGKGPYCVKCHEAGYPDTLLVETNTREGAVAAGAAASGAAVPAGEHESNAPAEVKEWLNGRTCFDPCSYGKAVVCRSALETLLVRWAVELSVYPALHRRLVDRGPRGSNPSSGTVQ